MVATDKKNLAQKNLLNNYFIMNEWVFRTSTKISKLPYCSDHTKRSFLTILLKRLSISRIYMAFTTSSSISRPWNDQTDNVFCFICLVFIEPI